ncbi:MAG: DUF3341 domain-containing protein [Bacteroidales bacterium]
MEHKLVSGYFLDEQDLVNAVKFLTKKQVKILDVFTPFPVHGLDGLLGLKKSNIPLVGFIFGMIGAVGAFVFQTWVFTKSYPLNIGGKPFFSVPSFIPVIFETTILFAAMGMVFAFLIRSKLGPGAENRIYDKRITDDHFVILLEAEGSTKTEQLEVLLKEVGARGIKKENNEVT